MDDDNNDDDDDDDDTAFDGFTTGDSDDERTRAVILVSSVLVFNARFVITAFEISIDDFSV